MKVKVNPDVCVGCGACQGIAPDVFEINDDGIAQAISEDVKEEFVEDARDAKEGCPVNAIYDPSDEGEVAEEEEIEEAA